MTSRENIFDQSWSKISPLVHKILQQESVSTTEWHNLFYTIYSIVVWNNDRAVDKIEKALKNEILIYVKKVEKKMSANDGDEARLNSYNSEWKIFFTQWLALPFHSFEKSKIAPKAHSLKKETNIVHRYMMNIWIDIVLTSMNAKLQLSAMNLVYKERNGEAFDSQLVIGLRDSYLNLPDRIRDVDSEYPKNYIDDCQHTIYKENFLKPYIESVKSFYTISSTQHLQLHGIDNYLIYASKKLKEEEERALKYLHSDSDMTELKEACVEVIVVPFREVIIAECERMMKQNQTEKLRLMFNLIDRISNGIDPMLDILEQHIIRTGLDEMKAAAETIVSDPEKFVDQLVGLFHRLNILVTDTFNGDHRFCTAKDRGFKLVLNDTTIFKLELSSKLKTAPESKCPEFFALYCDSLLKKSTRSKKLTSNEIDDKLKGVILMLKFIVNKDVFMQFYRTFLSRRLLLQTSVDSDKEESVVIWLKEIGMPVDYVNKLTKMFQDINISQQLNEEFKEKQRSEGKSVADSINVTVLNAASWALQSDNIFVSLPTELEDYIPEIEEFYKSKYNGRKLKWHHSISTGIISFANRVGKFDLEVTSFQMAILFAYNERPKNRISFENLKLATQLSDLDLRKYLWSLVSFPKLKRQIILCNPEVKSPKDFVSDNEFWINQEFAIMRNGKPANRGKLSLIGKLQFSTRVNARDDDNLEILKLRELRIQEAIVKIMKTRKKIAYSQLITEIVELLKNMFVPATKMIKEQLSFLINNQYIRRDNEDFNIFIYMA